jgi:metallo-beta-lactamase class B
MYTRRRLEEAAMSRRLIGRLGALGFSVVLAGGGALAQTGGSPDSHVAAAKAAATGPESNVLFTRLCRPPAPAAPAAAQPAPQQPAAPQGPPPRATWYAEPVKVFDNLYFVGQTEYTSWAVLTSEGIIVIDPLFDYSVEEEVVRGLSKLGADPKRIRYVLVSHAHRDHVGGARFLQDRGARVVMSAADWDFLARQGGTWPKPKRDMVATDGQKLTLGDTTLTIYHTPGHTPGTVSTLIPLKDGGRMHLAALWGGTGFNWLGNGAAYKDQPHQFWFNNYATSGRRLREVVAKAGVDVLLSNHPDYDGSKTNLPAMAKRGAGEPHPYVIGNDRVQRFLRVAEECALAGLGRSS